MKLLFIDFETYYDRQYTLKKLTPVEYVFDPRYETICVAVKVDDGPIDVIDGPDFPAWLAQFNPAQVCTVTYNALFDNAILAWRYSFIPFRMIDALGMARATLGHELRGFSLENVAKHLGCGEKGHNLADSLGKRRAELIGTPIWNEFKRYNRTDVELLYKVFQRLAVGFPASEYRVMDMVLRAALQPQFVLDQDTLTDHLASVRAGKAALLESSGAEVVDLMSAAKFSELLVREGVEVEIKRSPTGNDIPALAKTDPFMQGLLEHENPRVQALAAARLGHKSTLEETRCERLLGIARLPWTNCANAPIALRYSGAHTHRLSGDWKLNMQNLPRGSRLRHALAAPPGHQVVVADLGQIEARLTAWYCGATSLLQQFRDKQDPYAKLASHIFQREIDPKVDKVERFVGKTGVLGLGYGAGPDKFYTMALSLAKNAGVDLRTVSWSLELAKETVETYRVVNSQIPYMWRCLQRAIQYQLATGSDINYSVITIGEGAVFGRLPEGKMLPMRFGNVHQEGMEWLYTYGGRQHKLYGAKLLENIIQYLARHILMNAALRLNNAGYRFALQAHDELAFIVPDNDVDNAVSIIHREMVRPPDWAPTLPLVAELGVGPTYGEAK